MQLPAGDSARNEEKMTQLLPGTRRRSEGGKKGGSGGGTQGKSKRKIRMWCFQKASVFNCAHAAPHRWGESVRQIIALCLNQDCECLMITVYFST